MGAIIQNGNIGAIIKNGIVYGGGIVDGSEQINEVVRLTQTEYDNLATKYNNKLYLITNSNKDMIYKQYQGNRRILRKQDISDYEFWYEDLIFPDVLSVSNNNYHNNARNYAINTGIEIFSSSNYQKSFEIDFKVNPVFNTSDSHRYGNIIAKNNYTSPEFQIYVDEQINGVGITNGSMDSRISNMFNKDIRYVFDRDNGNVKMYVDDVLTDTQSLTTSIEADNPLLIGLYGTYSPFNGTINYIGFKWLDTPTPPTPSGADGLTYEVSVDNNYTLHLIEYDNGTQSQTASLTDSDLSSPVTFGDIVISYANDNFIIKPDYTNGKSIKYDNVLYSGDNAIEFYEGEAGLPDYAEQGTFTLIGWIE